MPGRGQTQKTILTTLSDEEPRTLRQLIDTTTLSNKSVSSALYRLWKEGVILRTAKKTYTALKSFKGRGGTSKNTRGYHLYLYKPMQNSAFINGKRFVKYSPEKEANSATRINKAELIRDFLRQHSNKAFYTTHITEQLKENDVRQHDIMNTVRRAEKKGQVLVRGYRTHDSQTPFQEGFIVTWIDPSKPRTQSLKEAVHRTNQLLADKAATSPIIQRVHMIRDIVIESTELKDLVSFGFIHNKLDCTEYEAESAITRAMQLYRDIKVIKLFNIYNYYYHESMSKEDLSAITEMKENYIRIVKGRENRIGHNWEAVVGWFIDKLTAGAKFWSQRHRGRMDPRRITIHLIKPVGGRRHNAEVDRVWEVTPGPLLQPTTYVLECKWGLVQKRHVDDFFDVLRWSKEFGVNTPDGRQIKQGITGVFAGSSFDPKETVRLKDESTISLSSYAARMNIQLLRSADFNQKLRAREIAKSVTVQMTCRYAKDEDEVRKLLDQIWDNPGKSSEILKRVAWKNKDIYDFEKILELSPFERRVLEYYRTHKDEFAFEKCAEELGSTIKRVEEALRVLKKKGLV